MQINAYVTKLFAIEIKKNQIAFLQLLFVFSFDNGYLLAGHPRQIDAVNLLFQQKGKAGTIYAILVQTAETVRRAQPLIDKSI